MNKNVTPLILIVLAIGIYFTFTRVKLEELKSIKLVNAEYKTAIDNSEKLIKVRDKVLETYNKIDPDDQDRLEKMLPDNVDNVRLIIDVQGVAAKHNLIAKNIKTTTSKNASDLKTPGGIEGDVSVPSTYDTVAVSFDVSTNYETFINFLKDLEASLRIMEITKVSLSVGETGNYNYGLELKTFWLKQ